jgi:hypothetical protein
MFSTAELMISEGERDFDEEEEEEEEEEENLDGVAETKRERRGTEMKRSTS